MAETLYVLNEGIILPTDFTATPAADTFNLKTSTNPTVITEDSSYSTSDNFSYYEIYDGEVSSFGGTKAAVLSTTNRQETPSYRVQLDTGSASGITLASGYDYYVLVYSDNIYKHHFAKLTEQTKYDGNFYNIDFTPKMKENVPSGTAVKIFKGPATSTSIVALGYGLINKIDSTLTSTYSTSSFNVAVSSSTLSVGDILISSHFPSGTKITEIVDSSNITVSSQPTSTATASVNYTTDERHDKYVNVSRPTFYFLEGDKLKPNHKYSLVKKLTSDAGSDVDKNTFFKTAPLSSDYILDKSFYTLHATIHDNNKDLDNNPAPNRRQRHSEASIGSTYTFSATTWNDSSRNIYYSDSGHKTYIGFIDSPIRNQLIPSAVNIKTKKTITNRGNSFEAKFSDVTKMLDKKVKHNERIKVKEAIKQQNLSYMPNATLYGVYNNHTDADKIQVSGLLGGQDLNTVLYSSDLSKYEQILIGSYYYLPSAISVASGGSQVITVANRRATSNSVYESSTTVASMTDATAYRKEWSPVVSNFITTHPIDTVIESGQVKRNDISLTDIESDINGLEYRLDGEYYGFSIDVLNGDSVNGYVTFSNSPSSSYYASTDLFSSLKGKLVVNKTIFEGRIETIEKEIEMGQHFFKLSGRDEIGKLLSTPINKNYNYSNEYAYSFISPFTTGFTNSGLDVAATIEVNESLIDVSGTLTSKLKYGDVLYVKFGTRYIMIGVAGGTYASGASPSQIQLVSDSLLDTSSSYFGVNSGSLTITDLYIGTKKLLAGKSINTDLRNNKATTLYGSLDKGYRFLGTGHFLTDAGSTEKTQTMVTYNGDGKEIEGLLVTQGSSIDRKDSPIGVDIEETGVSGFLELEYLGSNTSDEGNLLQVDIGYVSPLVLGRIDNNSLDSFYGQSMGLYLINANGLGEGGFIHLLDSINSTTSKAPITYRNIITDDINDSTRIHANYSMRFGTPIFRFNNLNQALSTFTRKYEYNFDTSVFSKNTKFDLYDDNPSAYHFYSSVFKIEGGSVLDIDYHDDGGNSNLQELSPEKTGYYPAVGSFGQDILYYPDSFKNTINHLGVRLQRDAYADKEWFEIDSPSISNVFLFSIGDALPESKIRYDNIFNSTIGRSLTDYYLLVKYKTPEDSISITHDTYTGNAKTLTYNDGDYEYFPIESASSSNPKRMNLLRLRTMTVDGNMNEVDYEKYETASSPISTSRDMVQIPNSIPNSGLSIYPCHTTSATDSSSTTISVDNAYGLNLTIGSTLFHSELYTNPADDSTGLSRKLGDIASVNAGKTTITLTGNCSVDEYSGEIFVIDSGTDSPNTRYKNGENYTYRGTLTSDKLLNNPNIHKIVSTTIDMNNLSQETFTNNSGVHNHRSFASVKIENIQAAGSLPATARITFDSINGVAPDLTNFPVGGGFTVANHPNAVLNTFYTITAAGTAPYFDVNTNDDIRGQSDDTSFSSIFIGTDAPYFSTVKRITVGNGIRLLHDIIRYEAGGASATDNSIFTGMYAVVVRNGETNNFSADYPEISQAKNNNFLLHNNYGVKIDSSGSYVSGSDTSVRLGVSQYFSDTATTLTGLGDVSLETNNAEILFTPVVDLNYSNVSFTNGIGVVGQYSGKRYLIIEIDPADFNNTISGEQRWIHYIGNLTGKYLRMSRLGTLHQIVNHHVSKRQTDVKIIHYLEIDNSQVIASTDTFTVLTVCEKTTQEDKRKIALYDYSQTNVINPLTKKFYTRRTPERDWLGTVSDTSVAFDDNTPIVKAMYVLADPDGMSSFLVHRDADLFKASGYFDSSDYSVCLSDGINKLKTPMNIDTQDVDLTGLSNVLTFGEMKTLHGSVSIGEVFNVSVIGKINRPVKSVKLVLPFDIQTEAEEIADDILSSAGLTYNKSQDYGTVNHPKYYIGSNFDGQDAFSAINSVLDYKGSKLTVDGESFSVVSNESNKDYRSIRFDEDSNDYNIVSFKRDISIYDKFNSVVIIGDGVRGIAKNHKEIQRDGAEKTKEIYDFSITSQVQADEKARKLLKVFSTLSNAIQLEIGSDIPHLEPGQIVELKFEREGIFRGDYIVIEISKQSGFPTKLLLGAYNKDLATTISLLLGETRNLQGRNKEVYKSYISPSISLQTTKIKFVGIKITSTTGSGTSTSVIGFGKTIGFSGGIGL